MKKESSISPGLMERSCVAWKVSVPRTKGEAEELQKKSFRKKIEWSQVMENPEYLALEFKLNQGQREPWKVCKQVCDRRTWG